MGNRAKHLSNEVFFERHEAAETREDAIAAVGLKPASFEQRCSNMRSNGWPLKYFGRNGGTTQTPELNLELIAKAKGITVEEAQAAIDRQKAKNAEREAKAAAKETEDETASA